MKYLLAAVALTLACPAEAVVVSGTVESGQSLLFELPSIIEPGLPFNSSYTLQFDAPVTDFYGLTQTRYTLDERPGTVTRSFFQFVTRVDDRSFLAPIAGFQLGQFLFPFGTVVEVEPARITFSQTFAASGPVGYRLFITPVPEPATWALMIGGFGLVGASARRRANFRSFATS